MTKQLPGPRTKPSAPEPKKHVWDSDWLNNPYGSKTCRVCGVTWVGGGRNNHLTGNVRADRMQVDDEGKKKEPMYQYIDIHGKRVNSFKELSCPIWIGDPASAAAQAKEGVRNVKGRVGVVEERMETVEDRLDRLEAENAALRDDLDRKQEIDARALMGFLVDMVDAAVRTREIEIVNARGKQYHVPRQLVDVIDVVSIEAPELLPARQLPEGEDEAG